MSRLTIMKKNLNWTLLTLPLLMGLARATSLAQINSEPSPDFPRAAVAPIPPAVQMIKPGPTNDAPYVPQPILQGGLVVPLYPPDSPKLNQSRIREAEQYTMTRNVPGRIANIVNVHNPSIEVHTVDPGINTGAAIILAAGGGHNTLVIGTEGGDFVPFFYNYGVNTVILRYRLRRDGYNSQKDAVDDAQQAIRLVRAHAKEWGIDPNKIGIMGFSAGAELSGPAAIAYNDFDQKNNGAADSLAGISSRPDFVGIIYPGPTPFTRDAGTPIPSNAPPSFIACGGSGDQGHAVWADQYFAAMLQKSVPNLEMHIYGNGHHPGSGSTGGLTDRLNTPYGTWQYRFIDWFRDLGFLQKPGIETQAARDVAAYVSNPPRIRGPRNGRGTNAPVMTSSISAPASTNR
jgi:acetyl esterase/lipase